MERCPWCGADPLYVRYHDEEWGVPVHDDRVHFEFLVLEAAQAGLSWRTVLGKRERYREVFAGFDPAVVRGFAPEQIDAMLLDPGIIRNRRKVEAAVHNAVPFEAVQAEFGSFSNYLWGFVDGVPIVNRPSTIGDIPPLTPLSDRVSADLKRRGFKFVGSTVIYAHLQATGLVNDHLVGCFRFAG